MKGFVEDLFREDAGPAPSLGNAKRVKELLHRAEKLLQKVLAIMHPTSMGIT